MEAASAGHTDRRPLIALPPAIIALRDEIATAAPPARGVRVGAAGGLGDPASVVAAFAMGAAYVVTGSINQAGVEAALGDDAKAMLAGAGITDTVMAPAGDMFEFGVRVQVLGCR